MFPLYKCPRKEQDPCLTSWGFKSEVKGQKSVGCHLIKPHANQFYFMQVGRLLGLLENKNILWKIRAENVTGSPEPLRSIKGTFLGLGTLL